jgi:hypothetical protein
MNEAETRAELIDPKLRANGWGVVEDSKILRERNVLSVELGLCHAFAHCQFITFRLNDCQLNALINQNIISN